MKMMSRTILMGCTLTAAQLPATADTLLTEDFGSTTIYPDGPTTFGGDGSLFWVAGVPAVPGGLVETALLNAASTTQGDFDSVGWVTNVGGSFIYIDLGIYDDNTDYAATFLAAYASNDTANSIGWEAAFLTGQTYATASVATSDDGLDPGDANGKNPDEYHTLEYTSGVNAASDRLFFQIGRQSGAQFAERSLFVDDVTITAVPTPATASLLALGLVSLTTRRRRR